MNEAPWLQLLNSDWHDHTGSGRTEDRLESPAWRARFLAPWQADLAGVPAADIVRALRGLRTDLRQIVDACVAGRPDRPADWAAVNACLRDAPLVHSVTAAPERPRLELVPLQRGLPAVLGAIAASFAATLAAGDPSRIKICQNTDCGWVFYDASRNRSRKWCEDTCGSLMKVRRFRGKSRPAGRS